MVTKLQGICIAPILKCCFKNEQSAITFYFYCFIGIKSFVHPPSNSIHDFRIFYYLYVLTLEIQSLPIAANVLKEVNYFFHFVFLSFSFNLIF